MRRFQIVLQISILLISCTYFYPHASAQFTSDNIQQVMEEYYLTGQLEEAYSLYSAIQRDSLTIDSIREWANFYKIVILNRSGSHIYALDLIDQHMLHSCIDPDVHCGLETQRIRAVLGLGRFQDAKDILSSKTCNASDNEPWQIYNRLDSLIVHASSNPGSVDIQEILDVSNSFPGRKGDNVIYELAFLELLAEFPNTNNDHIESSILDLKRKVPPARIFKFYNDLNLLLKLSRDIKLPASITEFLSQQIYQYNVDHQILNRRDQILRLEHENLLHEHSKNLRLERLERQQSESLAVNRMVLVILLLVLCVILFAFTLWFLRSRNQALELKKQLALLNLQLEKKNDQLRAIAENRREQLVEKSGVLENLSQINSHGLRAAFCRLVGLLNLHELQPKEDYLSLIWESTNKAMVEVERINKSIAESASSSSEKNPQLRVEKILLVDDDEIHNLLHREIIRSHHPDVEIFSYTNPYEAYENLKDQLIIPDLIFLDLHMHECTGFYFLKMMESSLIEIPVYVLSSSIDPNDRINSMRYFQVIGYIEKPLTASWVAQNLVSH